MSVVSWRRMASDLTDQVRELQKERDELLAEVARLKIDSRSYWKLVAKKAEADVDGCNGALVEAEAERDRLAWMLDEAVKEWSMASSGLGRATYSGGHSASVERKLADLADRYEARPKDGDG